MNELAQKMISGMTEKNSELEFKIKMNTELYRKGFGRIWLFNPDKTLYEGNARIRLKLKKHEYKFGASLFMLGEFPSEELNAAFEETFSDTFNLGVIPFYWKDLEPEPGKLRFDKNSPKIYRRPPPDLCVEFCQKYGIAAKGHPPFWNQWLPDWLPNDRREFMRFQERRVAQIAERYADKIFIWDAINEVFSANCDINTPYPENIMEEAFRLCEKYFPNSQLVLNEDAHWWTYHGIHSPFYLLTKELIRNGYKPGGLGFQYHCFPHYFTGAEEYKRFMNAENLYRMLDVYGRLEIPCSLTETSVMARPDMMGEDCNETQAIVTERLYRLWFSHPATEALVWWNPVDGTAAGAPFGDYEHGENPLRSGLFFQDLCPKPSGEIIRKLIKEEWHTETEVAYENGGDNRFHGFYGDYDAEICTDNGTYHKTITLSKYAPTNIRVKLADDDDHFPVQYQWMRLCNKSIVK